MTSVQFPDPLQNWYALPRKKMQHELNPYGNKGFFLYEFSKKSLYFDTNNRSSRVLKNMLIMVAENVA